MTKIQIALSTLCVLIILACVGGFWFVVLNYFMKIGTIEDNQAIILNNQTLILQAVNKDTCSAGQDS